MSEVTRILSAIDQGDPRAASQQLPLVYDELRKLAARRLAQERPGQPLDATGLVHEAYLRLAGAEWGRYWDHRGHFFVAATEAMRHGRGIMAFPGIPFWPPTANGMGCVLFASPSLGGCRVTAMSVTLPRGRWPLPGAPPSA
jgi:hypothetical protein